MTTPLEDAIRPFVDEAVHRYVGVHIAELAADISDKVVHVRQWQVVVNPHLPFREARRVFRSAYVRRILQAHGGTISLAAKALGISRRTLHRLVLTLRISPSEFRKEIRRPDYVRGEVLRSVIESALEPYKSTLHPARIANLYSHAGDIGRALAKDLPEVPLTLSAAEMEFEREYLRQVLEEEGSVTKLARKACLRFETAHRKLKAFGLQKKI